MYTNEEFDDDEEERINLNCPNDSWYRYVLNADKTDEKDKNKTFLHVCPCCSEPANIHVECSNKSCKNG